MISHCSWTHYAGGEPSDGLIPSAGVIASLPSLKHLTVRINGEMPGSTLPQLQKFQNLSTLSLSCSDDLPRSYSREIASAIKASPGLSRLRIHNFITLEDYRRRVGKCASLQRLFQTSRPELEDLELQYVPLASEGIREILSPKLKRLSISTLPGARRIEFDWRGLWSALKEARIELKILKAWGPENSMEELFSYLLSYTGLQKLSLSDLQLDGQEMEDRAATKFWQQVAPHHKNSLTSICAYSKFESGWCYGPLVSAAMQQCSSLRDLTVSVCSVDSSWAEAKLCQAREDGFEFCRLKEPQGSVENCGVCPAANGVF
jgi:hypothetical protein